MNKNLVLPVIQWNTNLSELQRTQVLIFRNILNCVKTLESKTNIEVAGSSRIYSPLKNKNRLINEFTSTSPFDDYGVAKAECMLLAKAARIDGLNVSTAILFNHESVLRKKEFLFHELASSIAKYLSGYEKSIFVRNANSKGDWHSAQDTVKGVWIQSNRNTSQDVLFCSGIVRSIKQIVNELFERYFHEFAIPKLVSIEDDDEIEIVQGDNSFAKCLGWQVTDSIIDIVFNLVRAEISAINEK